MAEKFKSAHLDTMRRAPQDAAGVIGDFLKAREGIVAKSALPAFVSEDSRKAKRSEALQQVTEAKGAHIERLTQMGKTFDASHQAFVKEVAAAFDGPAPKDSNESLAREIQSQRVWARTQNLLNAVDSDKLGTRVEQLVKQATADGDLATLRLLRQELPSYFESRSQSADLGQHYAGRVEEALAAADPNVAAAVQARAEVEDNGGAYRGRMAIEHATFALERDQRTAFVPQWAKGADGKDVVTTIQIPPIEFNA